MSSDLQFIKRASVLPEYLRKLFLTSFVFSLLILLFSTIFYMIAQPELPLFYTSPRPELTLAPKEFIFIFPVLSLTINILHLFLAQLSKDLDPLINKIFLSATISIQLILTAALTRVILITF